MSSLRQYLDIITEAEAIQWTPTPEQEKWLGRADKSDPYILSRMPGQKPPVTYFTDPGDQQIARQLKFPEAPAQPAAAPQTNALGVAPVAQLKTPSAGASADGNAGEVQAQTNALGIAPVAQLKTPSAGASAAGNDGEALAQANAQSMAQSAQPATPKNRDSMTFGQAFADARKGGEKTFTWKGKSYGTDLAKPKAQQPSGITNIPPKQGAMNAPDSIAKPTKPTGNTTDNPWTAEETAQYNDILKRVQGAKTQGEKDMANAEMLAWSQRVGKRMGGMSGPTAAAPSAAPAAPAQSAQPAAAPTSGADPMTTSPEYKQLLGTLNTAYQSGGLESPAYKQAFANFNAFVNKNKPVSETVSFADDTIQRIVSLVHYR